MTDHEMSVLTSRLHRLADDMAPPIDVVRQVREARARNRRARRVRITVLSIATATAAMVVGAPMAVDLLSARDGGEVATPTGTTPEPAPTEPTTPAEPSAEAAAVPAGWEPRSFQGITFAVPPGARMADDVEPVPPQGDPPTFMWNGPEIGADRWQSVQIQVDGVRGAFAGPEGAEPVIVVGAQEAYVAFGPQVLGFPEDELTSMMLDARTADGVLHLIALFPAGPAGEQMGRDLVASIDVTGLTTGVETLPDGEHFVQLWNINPSTGRLVIEPAEWLGTGRSWDCVPEDPGPYGTVDDVTEYCVGAVFPRQFIGYTATEFTVVGKPPHVVGLADFAVLVDTTVWNAAQPEPTPMLGWVTVEGGTVVAFEEVARQSA